MIEDGRVSAIRFGNGRVQRMVAGAFNNKWAPASIILFQMKKGLRKEGVLFYWNEIVLIIVKGQRSGYSGRPSGDRVSTLNTQLHPSGSSIIENFRESCKSRAAAVSSIVSLMI